MEFTEIKIYTSSQGIDLVTSVLMDIGISGFIIEDPNELDAFIKNSNSRYDYIDDSLFDLKNGKTSIKIYLPKNNQGADQLKEIESKLFALKQNDTENALGTLEIESSLVHEEDWANNWKKYFKPIEIGEKLVIKPSWEEYNNMSNRIILEIDPASAFGTGGHATTRLCLEALEQSIFNGCKFLDLGCGSGILSIGALLLGCGHATCVDIDENSISITKENMCKNNIDPSRYSAFCGNIILDDHLRKEIGKSFDVVVANIVSDVLIGMSAIFTLLLKPDSRLIVSGIIGQRAVEVKDAILAQGFTLVSQSSSEDWVCQIYKK